MRARWLRIKKTKRNRTRLLQAWNLTAEEVDVRFWAFRVKLLLPANAPRLVICLLSRRRRAISCLVRPLTLGRAVLPCGVLTPVVRVALGMFCMMPPKMVLMFQGQLMGPPELTAFHKKARDHGFAAYTQAGNVGRGRWNEERQWAGYAR